MVNTTVRLRDDQRKFIVQISKEKATDLSEFVRQCVDKSAIAVAKKLRPRALLKYKRRNGVVTLSELHSVRAKAQKARAR